MTNSKLTTKLIIVLAVCGLATAFAQRTTPPLAHALQFVPNGAPNAYFNDWSQVLLDLHSVLPGPLDVYNEDIIDALFSRHAYGAEFVIGFGDAWLLPDLWGFSFLDIDWELEILPGMVVLAVNDGFDWPAFHELLVQRGYETLEHNGKVSHHLTFDVVNAWQDWMLEPLDYLQHLTFLEDERILVAAVSTIPLSLMLDTYAGNLPTWSGGDAGQALSEMPAGPMAAWLLTDADSCNFIQSTDPNVHVYRSVAVSATRVGNQAYSTVVISFDDPAHALADLQPRTNMAIAQGDRGPEQRPYYSVAEAYLDEQRIWMHLDQLDAPWRTFEFLLDRDFPAVGCAW